MTLSLFVAFVKSSTPPVAVTAPVPSKSVVVVVPVVTVPKPVSFAAALPSVMPPVSVSEPPSSLIVPSVMFSAAPTVSAPLLPISRVWLLVVMPIAAFEVAALSNFRSETLVELIAATRPAPNVPVRSSVPPEAVMVLTPPVCVRLAATVPEPPSVAVLNVTPDPSVSVPPAMTIWAPPLRLWAPPLIVTLPFEIFSVWLALVMEIGAAEVTPPARSSCSRLVPRVSILSRTPLAIEPVPVRSRVPPLPVPGTIVPELPIAPPTEIVPEPCNN